MEPLPLIPRIQSTVTPEMGYLVREVFQNAFQAETATWRVSINLSKSCRQNPDLRRIAANIQTEIIDHKGTLDDLEYAELQIMKSQGYQLCRDQRITSNKRAMELIRLKRHPLYIDLHPNIVEKYPLLQSDDLLPPMHECVTDFRLDKTERIKMKKRLYRSKDSLLDEISIPSINNQAYKFDNLMEQRLRKTRIRNRLTTNRIAGRKRSIIRTEYLKTILIAEPEELFFHNFEYGKLYKKTIMIKNVSNSMARYKIKRRSPNSKFTIFYDTAVVETTKIAPGMHVKLTVLFLCDVIEDPEEFLLVNVEFGKTVCVKMHGYRDPPLLRAVDPMYQSCSDSVIMNTETPSSSFPSIIETERDHDVQEVTEVIENIKEYSKKEASVKRNVNLGANLECGKCFVGERIMVLTKFFNDGGNGKFFVMSEIDWCSMNIDDIMDCNMILIPPFALWPIYFILQSGDYIEIQTYFYPESYGTHVDKLYILCDNHAIHPIEIIGDGIMYDPNFVQFSGNIEKIMSTERDDELFAGYHLNMGDVGSNMETVESLVLVSNTSGLEMFYRWEKSAAKYPTSSQKDSWIQLPIENLDIQSVTGSLNPKSITSFRIVVQTKDLHASEHRAILRFYIEDIPLAAIPKDCNLRMEDCCVNRRNSLITVDILVVDIEVCVDCTSRNASKELHLDTSEQIERETRCSIEAEEIDSNDGVCSSSSSEIVILNLDKESAVISDNAIICGLGNARCNEYYKGVKNSEHLRSVSLGLIKNLDANISASAIPRLDFQYDQIGTTALLIPGRSLYVGIEQVYTLTLRNSVCKPLSYAWGEPVVNDVCKMRVHFNPDKGFIPPSSTAKIEVTCLPTDTGTIKDFFIPCFIGGQQFPIMLGIECSISALYVTFLFLPKLNAAPSSCVDSVRVEWHEGGHMSALNLNNLKVDRNSKIQEERELKNIDLDAGQVVATTAVGPTVENTENVSLQLNLSKTQPTAKQKLDNKVRNKPVEKSKLKDDVTTESKAEEGVLPELRSWESLLKGIIWTEDEPDEFTSLTKPQAMVPFYKTIVPPITQALAIEFVDLPLRTVRKRTFVIRNETPAESTFLITMKQFNPSKIIKELNPKETIDVTYANVMGHESENYWEKIMPPGQSIVVVIEPTSGNLTPYETVPIDIYVYADTWGVYVDEITVAIVGLPDYVFGVCTQVVGSPIAYPICRTGTNKTPILRFGSLDFGAESITRKILIENTSSVTLAVNWYSYLINSSRTESSVPFNIILQMVSPITDKITNMESMSLRNGHNNSEISTADLSTEEFQQSSLDSDGRDSTIFVTNSSISNHNEIGNQTQTSKQNLDGCCFENVALSDQITSRDKNRKTESSFITDYLNDEYSEYTAESEVSSTLSFSEHNEKETDLELTLTNYYGKPDYSTFTVSPAEVIIPVNGKKWIEVTLKKTDVKFGRKNYETELRGRLMGFIRVAPKHKYKADCYSRNDGIMLAPTEIQLQARTLVPEKSTEVLDVLTGIPDYVEHHGYGNWDEEYYEFEP